MNDMNEFKKYPMAIKLAIIELILISITIWAAYQVEDQFLGTLYVLPLITLVGILAPWVVISGLIFLIKRGKDNRLYSIIVGFGAVMSLLAVMVALSFSK